MSTAVAPPPKRMTVEEFLALPDDGHRRWLIDGIVYPREPELSLRNKRHGRVTTRTAFVLEGWSQAQPGPRGQVVTGDTGFRLSPDSDTYVGIDVAYAPPELIVADTDESPYFEGPPRLAVEILSPSNVRCELVKKIQAYLKAGSTVWVLDPDFRTIDVHRPGRPRVGLSEGDELVGDPELPGLRVPVARFFEE